MISTTLADRVVVEHLDPAKLVPGGIDTCVHDLVKFGGQTSWALVGITNDPNVKLGEWRPVPFGGRSIDFLPVARFDRSASTGTGLRVPHSARLAAGILRYRARIPMNLVQTHRIETGLLMSTLGADRVVQFIHNEADGLTGQNSDSSWQRFGALYRSIEKRVLRRASGVVLFNKTDGPRIANIRPDVVVSETWYDPETFYVQRDGTVADRSGPLTVSWVGRLEAQKDPVLAVQVLARLRSDGVDANLRMIGSGSLADRVRDEAVDHHVDAHVLMLGSLSRAEVAAEVASSSVMLMTSHYEGSPRVLAEAGALGVPVVATFGADPDSVLTEGQNGRRVEGRSIESLARALSDVANLSALDCAAAVSHRAAPSVIARLLDVGASPVFDRQESRDF